MLTKNATCVKLKSELWREDVIKKNRFHKKAEILIPTLKITCNCSNFSKT